MKENYFKICCVLLLVFLLIASFTIPLMAQRRSEIQEREESEKQKSLSRPAKVSIDEAWGELDKGELINITMNFGQITDTRFQSTMYNFRWPKSKGVKSWRESAVDDFSIVLACKGNVIDGYTDYDDEDWRAKRGSLGQTHADDQPDDLKAFDGTPRLAHSDLPATWPHGYFDAAGNFVSTPGERHWPGYFRIDINPESPTYGQEVFGEFAADREVYAVFTDEDNLDSPPIGIECEMQAYSYGRAYAADFQFYDFYLYNKSEKRLDSCWVGIYWDPDFGDARQEELVAYDTEFDPDNVPDVFYQIDPNGPDPDEPESGIIGVAILQIPKGLPVTDAHFFEDMGPDNDRELWPIIISDPNHPDLLQPATQWFHPVGARIDDFSLSAQTMLDYSMFIMSGPFTFETTDTIRYTIAVLCGNDAIDLQNNVNMAQQMFTKKFQGPSGPKAPTLTAVPGDGRVTLYWDNKPELTPDPFTGEYDFEGYKIYRSVDDGQTWGDPITDYKGDVLGYVPLIQFDLDNDIMGTDPLNVNTFLGSNTGLQHTWVDSTVHNGVVYTYTITAYDRGDPANNIESFESAKGSGVWDNNFVLVVPRSDPIGYVSQESELVQMQHTAGRSGGKVMVDIVDPDSLRVDAKTLLTNPYKIMFNPNPSEQIASDTFYLVDATGDTLFSFPINNEDMPVKHGFRVKAMGDETIGGFKRVTDGEGNNVEGAANPDPTNSWYVIVSPAFSPFVASKIEDYEIRFTEQGSVAGNYEVRDIVGSMQVPFEVWNVTMPDSTYQINSQVLDSDKDGEFDEGEVIRILNSPYTSPAIGDPIVANFPTDFSYKVEIMNTADDTLNLPPQIGQIIRIYSYRGFTDEDVYTFTIEKPHVAEVSSAVLDSSLDEIRVVPNPYIVNAPWERRVNLRRLRFMFLPPVCDIHIYTTRGELVKSLHHDNGTGDEEWNMTSQSNQDLAFGIYIYVVETPDGRKKIGKFALIK